MLAAPAGGRRGALVAQRGLLALRADQVRALVELIDKTIDALDRGEPMSHENMFDGFDPSRYEEEAKARWGGTPEFEESVKMYVSDPRFAANYEPIRRGLAQYMCDAFRANAGRATG